MDFLPFPQVSLGGAFQLPLSFINPNISASSIGTSSNFSHSPPPHISPVSQKIPLCEEFEVDQNCSRGDICLYAHPGMWIFYSGIVKYYIALYSVVLSLAF